MPVERNHPLSGKALERFTRKLALQMRLAGRVSRKRKNVLDRILTRLLDRLTRPRTPADDFMRDEIVDAGIGFTLEELAPGDHADDSRRGPPGTQPPA
jgi:hypothetical protein